MMPKPCLDPAAILTTCPRLGGRLVTTGKVENGWPSRSAIQMEPNGRASLDARSPVGSLIQEQLPRSDAVGVAEVGRHRQFLRRARDAEQLEAGLVREAVGLALVHFLRGPDEVFP